MQTKKELKEWLIGREKELITMEYELLDSFHHPEIDSYVRAAKNHIARLGEALHTINKQLPIEN